MQVGENWLSIFRKKLGQNFEQENFFYLIQRIVDRTSFRKNSRTKKKPKNFQKFSNLQINKYLKFCWYQVLTKDKRLGNSYLDKILGICLFKIKPKKINKIIQKL